MSVDLHNSIQLEKRKSQILIGGVVSFACWQIGQLVVSNYADYLGNIAVAVFNIMLILGAILWLGFSLYLFRFSAFMKANPVIAAQQNDERADATKHKAMAVGFVILLVCVSMYFALAILLSYSSVFVIEQISSKVLAHGLLIIGVVSSSLAYIYIDNRL